MEEGQHPKAEEDDDEPTALTALEPKAPARQGNAAPSESAADKGAKTHADEAAFDEARTAMKTEPVVHRSKDPFVKNAGSEGAAAPPPAASAEPPKKSEPKSPAKVSVPPQLPNPPASTPPAPAPPPRSKSGLSAAFRPPTDRTSTAPASAPFPPARPPLQPRPPQPLEPQMSASAAPVPKEPAAIATHTPAPAFLPPTPPPAPTSSSPQKTAHPIPPPAPARIEPPRSASAVVSAVAEPRSGLPFERSRIYSFALDDSGQPIVLGSGRFARLYLGYERRAESVKRHHRAVVIKMLQRDLEDGEMIRFEQEKALLEHLQGHPSIVELLASGKLPEESLPDAVRLHCEGDFLVLEKLDMTLMERLKGSRDSKMKEDLAALGMRERLVRMLEYVIPVASAVEFAHLVRNVCHRDINPSNVLLGLPDPKLAGSMMKVRLADFSAARMDQDEGVTKIGAGVPGTTYFQSPEQETNLFGLLVNVEKDSRDVEYFEDFYVHIAEKDTFAIVNHTREYVIREVDRPNRRFVLETPYAGETEEHVRGNVQKRVGRPADIYAIGALAYYLMSGACRNPKALNDTFRKFDEYDRPASDTAIEDYLRSEYEALQSAKAKSESGPGEAFRYQHFVDANDEPIPLEVMRIIARCMIRNKPDSYCASNELDTTAISEVVRDLYELHARFGLMPAVSSPDPGRHSMVPRYSAGRGVVARAYDALLALLRKSRR